MGDIIHIEALRRRPLYPYEMKIYKNGDRCPCCGQLIEGKSEEWLNDFSISASLIELCLYPFGEADLKSTPAPD